MKDYMSKDAKKAVEEIKQAVEIIRIIISELEEISNLKIISEKMVKSVDALIQGLKEIEETMKVSTQNTSTTVESIKSSIERALDEFQTNMEGLNSLVQFSSQTQQDTRELISRLMGLIEASIAKENKLSEKIDSLSNSLERLEAMIVTFESRLEKIQRSVDALTEQKNKAKQDYIDELGIPTF